MFAIIDGDVLIYRNIWKKETIQEAIQSLHEDIDSIVEDTFSSDYQIAVGDSGDNFRSLIYPEYKQSAARKKSREARSELFDPLKDYLVNLSNVTYCQGFESDDMLRIWHYEIKEETLLCSIDKDLDCIPGLHYNIRKGKAYTVTEQEADRFYWYQLLMGDTVDNIPGLPKVGPVKANKILEGAATHEEYKERVIEAYKEVYGDEWRSWLLSNGKLLHIWRYANDHFCLK
jgi:hypothetical protein